MKKDITKIDSSVVRSQFFDQIIKKYENFGRHLPMAQFFREYVKPLDAKLSLWSWRLFVKTYNQELQIRMDKLLDLAADKRVTEVELEESSTRKILAIADLTLDEIVQKPELLNAIPVNDRMKWLFQTMKSRDSRMLALMKVKSEKRKDSMYEDMLKGAQYGAIEASEVQNSKDAVPPPKNLPDKPTGVKINIPTRLPSKKDKIIEFNPDEL